MMSRPPLPAPRKGKSSFGKRYRCPLPPRAGEGARRAEGGVWVQKKKRARGPLFSIHANARSGGAGGVFLDGLHRQADAALLVDFEHLDLDDVAFL